MTRISQLVTRQTIRILHPHPTLFQTVDTDFSPGDTDGTFLLPPVDPLFQTVDTDFSPGDR